MVVPADAKDPVLLVKPDDSKKLDALLAKDTKPHVSGAVDGWTAVAATQKELDAYNGALAKGTLSDSDAYAKAMDGLPADALVRGYANGSGLPNALGAAYGGTSSIPGVGSGGLAGVGKGLGERSPGQAAEQIGSIGFAVSATESAVRIDGSVVAKSGAMPVSFTPALLDRVPADALVAVSFDGAGPGQKAIDQALKQNGAPLAALQKQLGVKLEDLAAALDGEGILYVRAGSPIPEITLAVRPKDATRAKATFAALVAKLGSSTGTTSAIPGFRLTTTDTNGVVFVSTAPGSAATFVGDGPKLTGTDRFEQAAKQIGFAGTTSGLGYVDIHALGPLLKTALGALGGSNSGSTASGLEGLSAFNTAIFSATADGSRTRFAAVVTVG